RCSWENGRTIPAGDAGHGAERGGFAGLLCRTKLTPLGEPRKRKLGQSRRAESAPEESAGLRLMQRLWRGCGSIRTGRRRPRALGVGVPALAGLGSNTG